MNGRFMQLWLQNERAKGASPAAPVQLPGMTVTGDASSPFRAGGGGTSFIQTPPLSERPVRAAADWQPGPAAPAPARPAPVQLPGMTITAKPPVDAKSYAAEAARQVGEMKVPALDKLVGKGPEEGSLEWFDQATPEEMMDLVNRSRAMVKIGR